MTKIIFIHGANGVGKSTLCKSLHQRLINSAWLDSEWCRMTNPFIFTDELIELTIGNITHILASYINCSLVEYIIFSYGFHGPRKIIYEKVMENIGDMEIELIPITITCNEEENIKRMIKDGRDSKRITRALNTRLVYEGLGCPCIDTTNLTVEESLEKVLTIIDGKNNEILKMPFLKEYC